MTWEAKNLSSDEFSRPTEPPVVNGILYRGKRQVWTAPSESFKTLAALLSALDWMRAGHGRFAVVDFESGARATRLMLEDLGATPEEIASVHYVEPDGPPTEADIEAIVAARCTLVIVDASAGAYDVSGLDDNKRADVEKFASAWIQPLWKRDISTLLLDHVTKNEETRGRYAIGSERKLGQADVLLGFKVIAPLRRGGKGLVRISTHKDRPAHLPRPHAAELALASDPNTHRITWEFRPLPSANDKGDAEDDFVPTWYMEKVSRYLETQSEPVNRSSIPGPAAVPGKRTVILVAVDRLHAAGYIEEHAGSRGARCYSSAKPYREGNATTTFHVPEAFPDVPGNADTTRSPFPLSIEGNGNGSDHQLTTEAAK